MSVMTILDPPLNNIILFLIDEMASRKNQLTKLFFKKFDFFVEAVPRINHQPLSLLMTSKLKIVSAAQRVPEMFTYLNNHLGSDLYIRKEIDFLISTSERSELNLLSYESHNVLSELLITGINRSSLYSKSELISEHHNFLSNILHEISGYARIERILIFINKLMMGHSDVVKAVIRTVDNITVLNNMLFFSCAREDLELTQLCLEEGGDDYETAMKMAVLQANSLHIDLLLKHQEMHTETKYYGTAFHTKYYKDLQTLKPGWLTFPHTKWVISDYLECGKSLYPIETKFVDLTDCMTNWFGGLYLHIVFTKIEEIHSLMDCHQNAMFYNRVMYGTPSDWCSSSSSSESDDS